MTGASITKATESDIKDIVCLVNKGYRGESSRAGWTTEADLLDGLRTDEAAVEEMLNKPGAVILKYVNEKSQLQGCVYLEKQDKDLYLGMLTVDPVLQGAGIGKELMKAAERHALEQQCGTVIMTVISTRRELIDWYKRKGYEPTGEVKPFPTGTTRFGIPKQPLEFIVMKKTIIDQEQNKV